MDASCTNSRATNEHFHVLAAIRACLSPATSTTSSVTIHRRWVLFPLLLPHPPPPEGVTRIWLRVFFTLLLLTAIHFILWLLLMDTTLLQRSPGDKIGAKRGAVTLSKSRMHLGSSARIHRVLNKAPSLFLAAQVSLFSFLFPHLPNSTYDRPHSVSMPRCRGRPYIAHMLSIPLLPVVEHRLSPPSYRTDKRRPATHEFGVLWVLQLAPSPRPDGFGYY